MDTLHTQTELSQSSTDWRGKFVRTDYNSDSKLGKDGIFNYL